MSELEVGQAFDVIKKAMADNPSEPCSLANSWHRNIAAMCEGAILTDETKTLAAEDARRIGNIAASRFMWFCFGVETKD